MPRLKITIMHHCNKEKDTTEHAINCEVIGQNMKVEVCRPMEGHC